MEAPAEAEEETGANGEDSVGTDGAAVPRKVSRVGGGSKKGAKGTADASLLLFGGGLKVKRLLLLSMGQRRGKKKIPEGEMRSAKGPEK